jgi:hypothetical protein
MMRKSKFKILGCTGHKQEKTYVLEVGKKSVDVVCHLCGQVLFRDAKELMVAAVSEYDPEGYHWSMVEVDGKGYTGCTSCLKLLSVAPIVE